VRQSVFPEDSRSATDIYSSAPLIFSSPYQLVPLKVHSAFKKQSHSPLSKHTHTYSHSRKIMAKMFEVYRDPDNDAASRKFVPEAPPSSTPPPKKRSKCPGAPEAQRLTQPSKINLFQFPEVRDSDCMWFDPRGTPSKGADDYIRKEREKRDRYFGGSLFLL
jgi:hypothetical protein